MNRDFKKILMGASVVTVLPGAAMADFFKDSSANLDTKNYYFNRDYREAAKQSKRDEWAQGFTFNFISGYTPGTVGFGLDVTGMLGVKLDSSPDRSGTGLLPKGSDGRAADEYSKLGVAGKVRISKTELRVGEQVPKLPVLQPNTSRLFPQTFQGATVSSKDISNLTLGLGQFDRMRDRESTDRETMSMTAQNGAYKAATSNQFRYAGGDYNLLPDLQLSYYYGELERLYQQHFFGLKHAFKFGPGTVRSELRYWDADKDGVGLAGKVDNRALSTRFSYEWAGHNFGVGYQKQYGDTPFPYVDGANTYLFTEYQLVNFSQTNERAWHARYEYDFAALGVPGLTFGMRYAQGWGIETTKLVGEQGREWERDLDIGYVVQSGLVKGLSLRWRNAQLNSSYANDINENRFIVGYTWALW
ncbi:porin [Pseudomonas putida]|uniref:OprD family porin n=1 Tax=Pseudomonas putida TaxID=303 RepID=UPI0007B6D8F6|nr:OprD family porin [Pseudomonas putida]ANC01538.1 porin [Pseudomonas putida]